MRKSKEHTLKMRLCQPGTPDLSEQVMDGKVPNNHPSHTQGKECASRKVSAGFALAHGAGKPGEAPSQLLSCGNSLRNCHKLMCQEEMVKAVNKGTK